MPVEIEELHAKNDAIQVTFNGKTFMPEDDSIVNVKFDLENEEFDKDIDDPEYYLSILSITGEVCISDKDPSLIFRAKIDTSVGGWQIKCTKIHQISGAIFPHQIDINIDEKSILVRFDVLS